MRRRSPFSGGSGNKDHEAQVDMAPLIDMVFLLLIFYIVTSTFLQETGVEINRPEAESATALSAPFVLLAISADGDVYLAGARIAAVTERAAIRTAVAAALREQDTVAAVVQADRTVPTGDLLRILDDCEAAGASSVDVAAVAP